MQSQTTIRCTNCGQAVRATVRTYIDVSQDPEGKAQLLTGRLNTTACANCGATNAVMVPLLYHDPSKELLVAYVPLELNMKKDEQERAIGELMKALPKENFKGYMFSPKRTLTMQGLVELVLEKDGVTPEMMEKQRQRVNLVQELLDAPDEAIARMVADKDDLVDMQFFQTITLLGQRMAQANRPDMVERVLAVQQLVAENSTYGRELLANQMRQQEVVQRVAADLQALGEDATRADFIRLARAHMDDENALQALVGLARPAFDYEFFQALTSEIGSAPASERDALEALRDRLTELGRMVDEQARARVQGSVAVLQALINAPPDQLDDMLRENAHLIDDTFMAVLTANLQEAERRHDSQMLNRLQAVYTTVMEMLQEQMQPELVFVNRLLATATDDEARQLIQAEARDYGDELLEVMDAVEDVLMQQGQDAMIDRLRFLRDETLAVFEG